MELTLGQALRKGIEAHKAGKVQEAESYYSIILKTEPKHPDANHNMGVLAVGIGKVQEALSFFKTALESRPSTVQFWLSYIDALIKLERLSDAKAIFDQIKSNGAKGDSFENMEQRLNKSTEVPLSSVEVTLELPQDQPNVSVYLNLDQEIKLTNRKAEAGSLKETEQVYQDVLLKFPKKNKANDAMKSLELGGINQKQKVQDPPKAQLQSLVNLYSQGQFQQAAQKAETLVQKFSKSAILFNIQGVILKGMGQLDLSVEAYIRALTIRPDYPEAYNNMGNALNEQCRLREAVEAYNKALAIKPDYAEAYNNMGNALKEQCKMEEAVEAYNKALAIKPDYAEAYNNIGNAFNRQGKMEEAVEAYNKALAIKPDYAEAYYNMGSALNEQGKMEEAVVAYSSALTIKPDYAEVWNNIVFPLKNIKSEVLSQEELVSYYLEDNVSNNYQIAKANLNYNLNLGCPRVQHLLDEALSALANANNLVVKNPEYSKASTNSQHKLTNKVVALVHFGRSGTGLLHSLIDGHLEVSSLPSIYLSEYFDHRNWERIISGGWGKMVEHFMAIYDVLFDATSTVPVKTKSTEVIQDIGRKEGMANVGAQRDESLSVDKTLFRMEIESLMNLYDQLDAFIFFKLVNRAYDTAVKSTHQKSIIFYHIHNPDTYAQLNFFRLAPKVNWVMMVREPVQCCESWLRNSFQDNNYFDVAQKIITMLFEIDNIIRHQQNCIGVRLEDLKERPRQTIPALCKWMGIEHNESLYEMTAQGKKWWGDPSSPDFTKDGMDPFGKTSINRQVGLIFGEGDKLILKTLFYPFRVCFGYIAENEEQFEIDLKKIRPMIDKMFDFEKTIIEQTRADTKNFIKSGSYLSLRSGLIDRWNTLNEFHTYPNMIKPLEIGE